MVGFTKRQQYDVIRQRSTTQMLRTSAAIRAARLLDHYDIDGEYVGPPHGERAMEMLKSLQADCAHFAAQDVASTFVRMQEQCESEIEKLFLLGLMRQETNGSTLAFVPKVFWMPYADGLLDSKPAHANQEDITSLMKLQNRNLGFNPTGVLQQFPIAGYRVDFLLFGTTTEANSQGKTLRHALVVECDGHDFHERTKEQAERDRKRERAIMMFGIQVMRFTGSELWKDADQCAAEAMAHIHLHQAKHDQE